MHCQSLQKDPKVHQDARETFASGSRRNGAANVLEARKREQEGSTRRVDRSIQAHMSESRCAR